MVSTHLLIHILVVDNALGSHGVVPYGPAKLKCVDTLYVSNEPIPVQSRRGSTSQDVSDGCAWMSAYMCKCGHAMSEWTRYPCHASVRSQLEAKNRSVRIATRQNKRTYVSDLIV